MPPASPNLSMILSAVVKTENYKMCLLQHSLHLPITSSGTGSNAARTALHFTRKTQRKMTDMSREGSTQERPEHKKQ